MLEFKASEVRRSTIRGATSARVTPPVAPMSANASQFGVGIPPPEAKPCDPGSPKIRAK